MKSIIGEIEGLNMAPTIMLVQLVNGVSVVAVVNETKKHLHLYNPMLIARGVNEAGAEFIKLIPFQPDQIVTSANTIVKKKNVLVFHPSDSFKSHYMMRLATKQQEMAKSFTQNEEANTAPPEESNANSVISFTKFRDYQKKKGKSNANLVLATANTEETTIETPPDNGPESA